VKLKSTVTRIPITRKPLFRARAVAQILEYNKKKQRRKLAAG
jgi:prophage antirepressor-like protein